MESTKLSSKGQIVIPKHLREFYNWQPGLEFTIIDTGDGLLLRPKRPFPATTLADVAGFLLHEGPALSLEEMEHAVQLGAQKDYGRR